MISIPGPRVLLVTNSDFRSSVAVYARALSSVACRSFEVSIFDGTQVFSPRSFAQRWENGESVAEVGFMELPSSWVSYKRHQAKTESGYDLVHFCSQRFSFLASDPSRHIITVHDLVPQSLRRSHPELFAAYNANFSVRLRHWYFWRSMKRAARMRIRIITDTQTMKEEVCAMLGYTEDLVDVVPIPVGVGAGRWDRDSARDFLGVPRSAKAVLSVSTNEPRKNMEALYRLVEGVSSDIHLIRVGPIDLARIPEIMRSRVHVFQGLGDSATRAAYVASDVLFFPSYSEGFGLPLVEAMANGVAVVASDIPSTLEVAGDAAIVCAPEDYTRQQNEVRSLLSDDVLRGRLSSAGLNRAARFTPEVIAPRLEAVYRKVTE